MKAEERALEALEFRGVLEMLARHSTWSPGKRIAAALRPSSRRRTVARWQSETAEARELVGREAVPMGGLRDVRDAVGRAERGGALSPEQLLEVAQTALGAARLKAFLLKRRDVCPHLAGWADLMVDAGALGRRIEECIDEEGGVRDRASPRLAAVRKRLRILSDRVRDRMESIIRSADAGYLQEPVITQRGGRYVVPVRREHRARIPGLVHDQSGSGATLFIEPQAVVDLNNARRQAESEEREEVDRILAELSSAVWAGATDLRKNHGYMTRIDLALARGKLSWTLKAVAPVMGSDELILADARHPLLGEAAVPISLTLGSPSRILVLTGPNTGGKTVTLKTVGLMALMAATGMHLPASGGHLPLFDSLFVDIGDEQGLEQSLSTFSSHMKNVIPVTREAGDRSLVLLDEIGAGTDPLEGTALAMAVLEELHRRRAFAVASTHYSELKSFAYLHPGLENASMEFDPETLAPSFRLVMGMPGRSNAFDIARRLGLPQEVLERATGYLSRENTRSEDLISRMQESHRQWEDLKRQAARDRDEARRLRERGERELTDIESRRGREIERAREEAAALVARAREQSRQLVARLRELEARAPEGAVHASQWEGVRHELADLERDVRARKTGIRPPKVDGRPREGDWEPGARALVTSLGQEGRVVSGPDDDGRLVVQLGAVRVRVEGHDLLEPEGGPEPRRSARIGGGALGRAKAASMSPEIHLRGLTVEEALERVGKYLDDALLAGMERVSLVHGKGTGTLRRAIGEYLDAHPRAGRHESAGPAEGGTGVTIVYLESR